MDTTQNVRGMDAAVDTDRHQREAATVGYQQSEQVGELFGALAKAQSKYKPVLKQNVNPFFKSKYADLGSVIDATKDALSANGLSVMQFPSVDGTAVALTTVLGHLSGQWLSSVLKMPVSKADAQGVGSAITYARRYSLQSVLGVAAEEDDDGSAAVSARKEDFKKPKETKLEPVTNVPTRASIEQRQTLHIVAKKHGWSDGELRDLLGKFGYEHTSEITTAKMPELMKEVQSREVVVAK